MVKKVVHFKKVRGKFKMAVSMAVIPSIKGEAARKILEDLKHPTITKEILDNCNKLSECISTGKNSK